LHWLIAEDEADIRNLVVMMAQVWGHTPLSFESGQRVWDWLDEVEAGQYDGQIPDFALMDIRMPGYKGHEVARRIRTVDVLKNIPIVLMTAFVLSDSERQDMIDNFGVDHIVKKPLPDFVDLQQILQNIIDRKQVKP
jgi:CheY-like chemotaxis protein